MKKLNLKKKIDSFIFNFKRTIKGKKTFRITTYNLDSDTKNIFTLKAYEKKELASQLQKLSIDSTKYRINVKEID